MSSYYDDPDFADEYRYRDEMALDFVLREREAEDEWRLRHPKIPSAVSSSSVIESGSTPTRDGTGE